MVRSRPVHAPLELDVYRLRFHSPLILLGFLSCIQSCLYSSLSQSPSCYLSLGRVNYLCIAVAPNRHRAYGPTICFLHKPPCLASRKHLRPHRFTAIPSPTNPL
ncbi:hypothetical protein OH77DRAFT_865881 [Trametes cingulata]|nr:hypothetical protein OH77DRAFT_865881 [Trametes cingulata]